MIIEDNDMMNFSSKGKLMPQEETLLVGNRKKKITIGVPKETSYQENRIPLAPQAVGLLIANGNRVIIESNAGKAAHFDNNKFSEAGADIVETPEEVFTADIIIKVAPPSKRETELLKNKQTIISSLHLTGQNKDFFKTLMAKKMTAIAYEFIKDKTGSYPVRNAMSEIVGTASVFTAANFMSDENFGKGKLLGGFPGITPSEVVILGAGTVAEYAARAALGLGASVKVFDSSLYRLSRLQHILNTRIFTSIIQPRILLEALKTADVVIGAIHAVDGLTPVVVTEDMVRQMKPSSVILDISIDQGGCIETSEVTDHNQPVFRKYDFTHYCVPNIASKVPYTASYALSNFFTSILLRTADEGGIDNLLISDYGLRQGVYMYNGIITKPYVGEFFSLPYQDIELLMAAIR